MPTVSNGLTEKMKRFAREYYNNGGNGTEAYLMAYDTTNRVTASREAHELLKDSRILEYIKALNIPQENKAITERQKKREILWQFINDSSKTDSDRLKAMDLLNKMDSEYVNITRDITEDKTDINNLETDTLLKLVT